MANMELLSKIYEGDIHKYRTMCCALSQFSLTKDYPIEDIRDAIEEMKKESEVPMDFQAQMGRNGQEKAVFVIAKDDEFILKENLANLGFTKIAEFHRRNCYSSNSMLEMWFLSWE